MEQGTVARWLDEEGWGVIDSPATPGGCWAHFSALEMAGYRGLVVGARVDFTWGRAAQDGFDYRAVAVRPRGATPPAVRSIPADESSGAYGSTLVIRFDDGTVVTGAEAHRVIDGDGSR